MIRVLLFSNNKNVRGLCIEGKDWHLIISVGKTLRLYISGHMGKHGFVCNRLLKGTTMLFGIIPLSLLIW